MKHTNQRKQRFIAAIMPLCFLLPASAQNVVGIPSNQMNYVVAPQKMSQWCWAACISMVMDYHGVDMSQETIVARSFGANPNGPLPNWAGSAELITANLNGWGVSDSGVQYVVSCGYVPGAPAPAALLNSLNNQHPVIVGIVAPGGGGHAMVVTAATFVQTPAGPFVQSVILRDPFPTPVNIANRGRVVLDAQQFAAAARGTWFVSVAR